MDKKSEESRKYHKDHMGDERKPFWEGAPEIVSEGKCQRTDSSRMQVFKWSKENTEESIRSYVKENDEEEDCQLT